MKDYKVTANKDKKANSILIGLQGHLGLGQIKGIQTEVLKNLKGCSSTILQVKEIEESDLSFYQLVESIKKYCAKYKIDLKIDIELPAEQQALYIKSGINLV